MGQYFSSLGQNLMTNDFVARGYLVNEKSLYYTERNCNAYTFLIIRIKIITLKLT